MSYPRQISLDHDLPRHADDLLPARIEYLALEQLSRAVRQASLEHHAELFG